MMDGTHTPTEQEATDSIEEPAKGAWVNLGERNEVNELR